MALAASYYYEHYLDSANSTTTSSWTSAAISGSFIDSLMFDRSERPPQEECLFDPKNLWSEPKCLITDTVQNVVQK